jgi:Zn-dependent alcohol dehydrogenase
MSTYRAIEVTGHRQFQLVDRPLREPGANEVQIKVLSCGVCQECRRPHAPRVSPVASRVFPLDR